MTDRITKPITAMKEYGRKPYLVTKDTVPYGEKADYRYMMDTTWHKQQDNEQIVVQSVKKKPYQNSDYQAMEQGYDFPILTIPHWNFNYDFPFDVTRTSIERTTTETESTGLRWIQTPSSLSASKQYTVIVANSSYSKRTYTNGKLGNNWLDVYTPSELSITKASSDAEGLSIVGVTHKYSTSWFTIETSADVTGDFYLNATDGKNVIKEKITSKSSGYYVYFYDTGLYHKLNEYLSKIVTPAYNITQINRYDYVIAASGGGGVLYTESIIESSYGGNCELINAGSWPDAYWYKPPGTYYKLVRGVEDYAENIYALVSHHRGSYQWGMGEGTSVSAPATDEYAQAYLGTVLWGNTSVWGSIVNESYVIDTYNSYYKHDVSMTKEYQYDWEGSALGYEIKTYDNAYFGVQHHSTSFNGAFEYRTENGSILLYCIESVIVGELWNGADWSIGTPLPDVILKNGSISTVYSFSKFPNYPGIGTLNFGTV